MNRLWGKRNRRHRGRVKRLPFHESGEPLEPERRKRLERGRRKYIQEKRLKSRKEPIPRENEGRYPFACAFSDPMGSRREIGGVNFQQ